MHEYFACMYLWMYICMYVCVYTWTTCMLVPWGQGEGVRSSGPRVTYGFELPWGCWEPNLGFHKSNKCSSMLSRLPCSGRCAYVWSQLSQTWSLSTRPIWLLLIVYQSLPFLLLLISGRHPKHAILAYGTKKIFPSSFSEAPIFLAYLRATICLTQPQSVNFSISLDLKPVFFILILR